MKRIYYLLVAATLIPQAVLGAPHRSASDPDRKAVLYGTIFYETDDPSSCIGEVPSSTDLPKATVDAINKLKDLYTKAAEEKNLAWQMLASLDYEENSNNPTKSTLAGEDLGSANPDHPELIVNSKLDGLLKASDYFRSLASATYGVRVTPETNGEDLKKAFLSYNRGSIYKDNGGTPEVSPYVMNNFDADHRNMHYPAYDPIRIKYGDQVKATDGAYTIFTKLTGGVSCGDGSGSAIVDVALKELAKDIHEIPDGSNFSPEISRYTDGSHEPWCADFVSWVYNEAGAAFTGGTSGGWRLPAAAGPPEWLKANGIWHDRIGSNDVPQPGDVVYFAWGGDPNTDHVGIVEKVDGANLITIEGNSSNAVVRNTHTDYKTDTNIGGWGRRK